MARFRKKGRSRSRGRGGIGGIPMKGLLGLGILGIIAAPFVADFVYEKTSTNASLSKYSQIAKYGSAFGVGGVLGVGLTLAKNYLMGGTSTNYASRPVGQELYG